MISQQFSTDIDTRDGRMDGTTGHKWHDVAETVAGVDDQGSFFLRIFNFVFITAEICRVCSANQKHVKLILVLE